MPGIFGAYENRNWKSISDLMEQMIASLNPEKSLQVDISGFKEAGLFLGRISLGVLNGSAQPVKHPVEDCHIVFHGELYGRNNSIEDPRYILEQYIETGDRFIEGLNGIFHICIYDGRTQQIKLFSDKFGLQPLYYAILPDGVIFGAEVKALIQSNKIRRTPDRRSIADFLHYGQILGQKTLFEDIILLAPGSVFTYCLESGKTSLTRYWNLMDLFSGTDSPATEEAMGETVSLLIEAIKLRSDTPEAIGLSLSGGLDSRGILAGLQEKARGIRTYTLGLEGCADERLAMRMAGVAETRHEFIPLDEKYLGDYETMSRDMIHLSDGMYHPHESTEMAALEYLKKADFRILLRGHGGEVAKAALAYPVMVSENTLNLQKGIAALDDIFDKTNLVIRDAPVDRCFTSSFRNVMKEAPMQSLKESCTEAWDTLSPADLCIYYYINEHVRRQVVASLDIFRTQTEIRLPYMDEHFMRSLFRLPVKNRNRGEIHKALIRNCMPALSSIPDSNTGAPLDAGPLQLFVTDKFNSLMKKLSIKGFRHYTEFEKWHRERFKESSHRIIFCRETASRNIYNMKHLESIFELHTSGRKNYAHLLGTITGLELWFRAFNAEAI